MLLVNKTNRLRRGTSTSVKLHPVKTLYKTRQLFIICHRRDSWPGVRPAIIIF